MHIFPDEPEYEPSPRRTLRTWSSIAATKRRKAIHRRGAENAEKTTTYTQNLVQKTRRCGI
ncbi:MAG: hypothetical protein ACLQBD_27155, partial [Syntrophobacteraceae bacterium]